MKIEAILSKLEFNDGTFPRRALQEAMARKDSITPYLLDIVKDAAQNIDELAYEEDYVAHVYAMYLLAQFQEKRAYPLIVDFFSIPGEVALDVSGDVVTEDLNRILASVSGDDTSLIKSLIENEQANLAPAEVAKSTKSAVEQNADAFCLRGARPGVGSYGYSPVFRTVTAAGPNRTKSVPGRTRNSTLQVKKNPFLRWPFKAIERNGPRTMLRAMRDALP